MSEHALQIQDLHCGYGDRPVLRGVSVEVPRGEFLAILGPNGSGKTTLLRALTGLLRPTSGRVLLNGSDVSALRRTDVARQLACVLQDGPLAPGASNLPFSVRQVVTMGRTPYLARTGWESAADRSAVERAMHLAEVTHLADRPITELSGGERQRSFIAMALAQETDTLLLDEPTNHLDITHQLSILDLFARLNRDRRTTLVAVFHDLNLAAEYCHRLLLLKDGAAAALGPPAQVLTPETIAAVYNTAVHVQPSPATGRPHVFLAPAKPAPQRENPPRDPSA